MSVWDFLHGSRAAQIVAAQLKEGDVSHAWVLIGPSGSGKKPAALAIAAALNCPIEPGVGCGECSPCARILRQRHPDVHHVIPEGPLIPVDTIREMVIPEATRSTFEGAAKVFVIEEAHRMNEPAQNALLKTLEEPQPDVVFVLTTDQEEEILETIRSRCRIVRFEPVSEKRIVELLVKYKVDEQAALLSARLAEGDYERARTFAFDDTARRRRDLWITIPDRLQSSVDALDAASEIIEVARGAVKDHETLQKQEITELAEALGEGRGTASARNALAKRHKRELRRLEEQVLGEALASFAGFYRDVLAVRTGGDEAVANIDQVERLSAWAASEEAPDVALVRAMERCLEARGALPRNANVPLTIESTLVEIASLVSPPKAVISGW